MSAGKHASTSQRSYCCIPRAVLHYYGVNEHNALYLDPSTVTVAPVEVLARNTSSTTAEDSKLPRALNAARSESLNPKKAGSRHQTYLVPGRRCPVFCRRVRPDGRNTPLGADDVSPQKEIISGGRSH